MPFASYIGGCLGRMFGPLVKAHRVAHHNIANIFPEKSKKERNALVKAMWDNLGRTAAEFPHMPRLQEGKYLEILGREYMRASEADGYPTLFVSGHFGNWETLPVSITRLYGSIAVVYRHANNPWTDKMIQYVRNHYQSLSISKTDGTRDLVKTLKASRSIGMLIDQKMNTGVAVPFFGRDAMTSPAPATAMLKYGAQIVPVRTQRLKGCRFRVTAYPPIDFVPTGDHEADTAAVLRSIHEYFEIWIRDCPEQWFWVHRRWPASLSVRNSLRDNRCSDG